MLGDKEFGVAYDLRGETRELAVCASALAGWIDRVGPARRGRRLEPDALIRRTVALPTALQDLNSRWCSSWSGASSSPTSKRPRRGGASEPTPYALSR